MIIYRTSDVHIEQQINVHVINIPGAADMYLVHEVQLWNALRGADELRDRVRLTIGLGPEQQQAIEAADVLVGWQFPREVVARATNLRWIHVIGAGVEHLQPLDWVPEGVVVSTSSGAHVPKAGEFIACALLMLNNQIPLHMTNQRAHKWSEWHSSCIGGKTVAIIGVGALGGEGARRAKELGLRVRGVRQSGSAHDHVDEMYGPDEVDRAVAGAHFLLVTAALTPATSGLIGGAQFDLLAPGAGVINVARAGIVDYDELAARLADGSLSGAVLDVFDPEPIPPESQLWDSPRLVITPHVALDALDYTDRMLAIFAENLALLVDDQPLRNQVHRDRGY
jgi:phosphoglycerate dehydrogenase-like enzyme